MLKQRSWLPQRARGLLWQPLSPNARLRPPPGMGSSSMGSGDGSRKEEGGPAVAQASRELNMNSRAV